MKIKTDKEIHDSVLTFYQELPFNVYDNPELGAKKIKENNALEAYPILKKIFKENKISSLLDIGCGGGWFVNSISSIFPSLKVCGIDFNHKAITYAKNISQTLDLNSEFFVRDIFEISDKIFIKDINSGNKFDFVSSIGVLHHTYDCHKAINISCDLVKSKGFFFLGLYHKFGRKPFLDFVKGMKNLTEKEKFNKYRKIHKLKSETHLWSWFRDQVLIPHETQHTYEEISKLFLVKGFKVCYTSINKYEEINSHEEIFKEEKKLFDVANTYMGKNIYFPGFFIIIGQKK